MGLINVKHYQVTESISNLQLDLLKNPYALYNDKKATPVDYFNINTNMTSLDEATKIPYAHIGKGCPLRFNLIRDFYLYGMDRVSTNLSNGDFGLESDEITGDAIVLPNTIHPYPGDYFEIKLLKRKFLFIVKEVTSDTFENGGNYWKLSYRLEYMNDDRLLPLVTDEYKFTTGNVGSNFNPVIKKAKWDLAKILDDTAVTLKEYYNALFFNNKSQTYTFVYLYAKCPTTIGSDFFYDPFLIEFIIKNRILANATSRFIYIDHKTHLRADFPIKYNNSIWRILETKKLGELTTCTTRSSAIYIDDPGSIFNTRYESYFELTYNKPDNVMEKYAQPIDILNQQVIGFISNKQLFEQNSKYAKYNIFVKYFNDMEIGVEDIVPIESINETSNDYENYFFIPMLIFILEYYIKDLMRKDEISKTS